LGPAEPRDMVNEAAKTIENTHEDTTGIIKAEKRDPFRREAGMLGDSRVRSPPHVAPFSAVSFHVHRLSPCEAECGCICHSHTHMRSPGLLSRFFGVLFLGYRGLPLLRSKCNIDSCSNRFSRSLKISYTFPPWFLARTLQFVMATTYTNEPEFGLKVRNRVEYSSEHSIFQLARQGQIKSIQRLFEAGLASPNDISFRGGSTAFKVILNPRIKKTMLINFLSGQLTPKGVTLAGSSSELELIYTSRMITECKLLCLLNPLRHAT
jgi:hypothetical protein